ncbi:cobalt ECF transporter T component CbiQ [Rhizobium sp. BK376]|uniref:cobalt ECF transporter T component CbiQ n=1 Tax=Rhizobium sp. BK376 TaxID=2512149 RepID=UPI0010474A97|nr:cobalt ECF transporter T component CbiQ [Rhizobium sp. BK376]TCR87737.1 cobalt/nickel transport system permease protein [Rhizobium sp. BK376]
MSEQSFVCSGHHGGFLDRLTGGILHAIDHALDADDLARRDGFLQRLDPRVKIAGLMALVVTAVSVHSLLVLAALFLVSVALALPSHVNVPRLAKQVWASVLAFTGTIALPAIFLVPGDVLLRIPILQWPVTLQGLRSAAFLLGRSETAATLALLMILCTPWPHVLKALRVFRLPVMLVVILGMTHRYVFTFLQSASQMFEARRSRVVGKLSPRDRRRIATASAGVLLGKALHLSTEVHLAMISRGYRGEVHLLDEFRMTLRDWLAVAGFAVVVAAALFLQST